MQFNFPKIEEEILNFWREKKIFPKTLKKTRDPFIFYEGPPTANGRPGIHHILARSFKDIICRYKTMQGYYVPRKAGWDTHGLPVEIEVEKEIKTKNKKDIDNFGIENFNKKCKESVWKYKKEWEGLTERIGFWLDMENPYITYEPEYVESLWWILKEIYRKDLLYQDYKVVPYCPRCGTSLSSHEVALGYKTVKDLAVIVKFPITEQKFINEYCQGKPTSFLAWTTTSWSLPTTMALAIGADYNYIVVRINEEQIICVKERLDYIMSHLHGVKYEIINKVKGKEMEHITYEHPFEEFYRKHKKVRDNHNVYKTHITDYVSIEEGAGIVTINGAFGEIDMEASKKIGLPVIVNVKTDGTFTEEMGEFSGMNVKPRENREKTDVEIIKYLGRKGVLFAKEKYEHSYPHCWRCDSPLLYCAKESWFINMRKVREDLIKNNQRINWVPAHLKEGRFGEWLREVKDWTISRERYWGTPLPVWRCQTGKSQIPCCQGQLPEGSNPKSQTNSKFKIPNSKQCDNIEVIGSREDLRKQKFSKNRYFVLRHGLAETNVKKIVSSAIDKRYSLANLGKEQIEKSVSKLKKKLKKQKIDIIFSSDIKRCKESAEIAAKELNAKIIFSPKIREINVGVYEGKSLIEYRINNPYGLNRFRKKIEGGESWNDCKMRMVEFIEEIEKKYQNKNILIVSHGDPIWLLEGAIEGLFNEELFDKRKKMIKEGEIREIEFKKFPLNREGEIDFHRPYIDEVKFYCSKCSGEMERVKSVVDCWFDSGAMPFAQAHFPFACAKSQISNLKTQNYIPPELFPADYICEGVDQTRGWFYTLLAVSTLLGFKNPYKNVISLGIVLDKKGQKMSKSKGNTVDPFEIIGKYGADSIRWYFFTINQPGEPKKFDENDLKKTFNKFILTLWNSYTFFETYGSKKEFSIFTVAKSNSPEGHFQFSNKSKIHCCQEQLPGGSNPKSKINILDRWILSRLQNLILFVSDSLNKFDVISAAREIEKFTLDDLSNWHIRRSRRRFQKPKNEKELKEATDVLGFVLFELAKLTAPFIPFLSEKIYQSLRSKSKIKNQKSKIIFPFSVHLCDYPSPNKKLINKKLDDKMIKTREIVALALAERKKAGIKVRQPLQKLKVKSEKLKVDRELIDLIKEEVNVKEVVFDSMIQNEVELDTEITPELKEEGMVREIIREIQEMRKKSGLKKENKIKIYYEGDKNIEKIIGKNKFFLKEETFLEEISQKENPPYILVKGMKIDGKELNLKIK